MFIMVVKDFTRFFCHQKAPGKGGHHLGLFGPITHLF